MTFPENVETRKIADGPEIILCSIPGRKTALVSFFIKAGAIHDPAGKAGLAHFVEHLKFRQVKQHPRFVEIEARGSTGNAWTDRQYTWFYLKTGGAEVASAVSILAEVLMNKEISPKNIALEKKVIIEEIQLKYDNLGIRIWAEWLTQIYDFPEGRPTLGTPNTIETFKQADIMSFIRNWYRPENMLITVVGDIGINEKKTISSFLERTFEAFQKVEPNYQVPKTHFPINEKLEKPTTEEQSTQRFIALGFAVNKVSPRDAACLRLWEEIVSGSCQSPIYQLLREDSGLAYQIISRTYLYNGRGYQVYVVPAMHHKVKLITSIIQHQFRPETMKRLGKIGLEQAKTRLLAKYRLRMDDLNQLTLALANWNILGPAGDIRPETLENQFNTLGPEQLTKTAEKYFSKENWRTVIL